MENSITEILISVVHWTDDCYCKKPHCSGGKKAWLSGASINLTFAGGVLFEYLEILPCLKSGVIVHVHDIFSPKDYLNEWKIQGVNFWDEQYLLEAFLSCNSQFEIICAVNYLKNNFYNELASKCPFLTPDREPGSFWIKKIE